MKKTVIKTGNTLQSFLDNVISESVKSALYQKTLQEKEKQQAASGSSIDDLFGSDDSGGGDQPQAQQQQQQPSDDQSDEPQPSKTMDDDEQMMTDGEVEPKDVVDKLNAIRSGKSFKDDKVKAAMEQYIGSLSKAEKTALFTFMKGIAQIVTGEIPGQQAVEPDEKPADVQMHKGHDKHTQTKQIQPNVIKGHAPKKAQQGGENTSSPTPITPKRR